MHAGLDMKMCEKHGFLFVLYLSSSIFSYLV